MKQIMLFKMISAAALLALTVSCASTQTSTQNRESMLVASGFKMITPKTPAQQQKLQNLPPTANKLAKEDLETAETYQDAEMQWSLWGGWGGGAGFGPWGPMGGPF